MFKFTAGVLIGIAATIATVSKLVLFKASLGDPLAQAVINATAFALSGK